MHGIQFTTGEYGCPFPFVHNDYILNAKTPSLSQFSRSFLSSSKESDIQDSKARIRFFESVMCKAVSKQWGFYQAIAKANYFFG